MYRLKDQPAYDQAEDRDPDDVAALQLVENRNSICDRSPCASRGGCGTSVPAPLAWACIVPRGPVARFQSPDSGASPDISLPPVRGCARGIQPATRCVSYPIARCQPALSNQVSAVGVAATRAGILNWKMRDLQLGRPAAVRTAEIGRLSPAGTAMLLYHLRSFPVQWRAPESAEESTFARGAVNV